MTYVHVLVLNAWLLVHPSSLSYDWSMDRVALITRVSDPRNALSLLALLALTAALCTHARRHTVCQGFSTPLALLALLTLLTPLAPLAQSPSLPRSACTPGATRSVRASVSATTTF